VSRIAEGPDLRQGFRLASRSHRELAQAHPTNRVEPVKGGIVSEPIDDGGTSRKDLAITPDAKLGALLERWPVFEQVLIDMSPHFRALRNPVLRRTVARVATLRQVSSVSGVALGTLIARLRSAAGLEAAGAPGTEGEAVAEPSTPPSWLAAARVTHRHDARAAIEAGEHPLPQVMRDLGGLGEGDVYELITPFVPAPLLDMAREKGFLGHSVREAETVVRTYFRREPPGAAGS
jgi:hypothetical protein